MSGRFKLYPRPSGNNQEVEDVEVKVKKSKKNMKHNIHMVVALLVFLCFVYVIQSGVLGNISLNMTIPKYNLGLGNDMDSVLNDMYSMDYDELVDKVIACVTTNQCPEGMICVNKTCIMNGVI